MFATVGWTMLSVVGWLAIGLAVLAISIRLFFWLLTLDWASPFKRVDYGKKETARRKALGYEK